MGQLSLRQKLNLGFVDVNFSKTLTSTKKF